MTVKIIWKRKRRGHLQLGKMGENCALCYLQSKRYLIVARNYTAKSAELDIVARRGSVLAFVEVKTRATEQFGAPVTAITEQKMEKIVLGVNQFCQRFKLTDFKLRLDVIEVELKKGFLFFDWLKITHHINAFAAPTEF